MLTVFFWWAAKMEWLLNIKTMNRNYSPAALIYIWGLVFLSSVSSAEIRHANPGSASADSGRLSPYQKRPIAGPEDSRPRPQNFSLTERVRIQDTRVRVNSDGKMRYEKGSIFQGKTTLGKDGSIREDKIFSQKNGCVLIGYSDQKGVSDDSAMNYANGYWEIQKRIIAREKRPDTLKIVRVNSVKELIDGIATCPKGGDITIEGHGPGPGGGFCVGKNACVGPNDAVKEGEESNLVKLAKAFASVSTRSIWLASCLTAEGLKNEKLGNSAKIDESLMDRLANLTYQAMGNKNVEEGSSKIPPKPRVYAFTTTISSGVFTGSSATEGTVRLTFEPSDEVVSDVAAHIQARRLVTLSIPSSKSESEGLENIWKHLSRKSPDGKIPKIELPIFSPSDSEPIPASKYPEGVFPGLDPGFSPPSIDSPLPSGIYDPDRVEKVPGFPPFK